MPEIHLSEQDEKFIEEQVAAGVYSDADAVIHASLQLLSSDERKRVALKLLIQGIDDAEAGRVHRCLTRRLPERYQTRFRAAKNGDRSLKSGPQSGPRGQGAILPKTMGRASQYCLS